MDLPIYLCFIKLKVMEQNIFYTVSLDLLLFYKGTCKEEVKCIFKLTLN